MDRKGEEKPTQASWVKKEVIIAGLHLKNHDQIEIGLGRQRILGTFRGFDKILYAFHIETEDANMVIPYKQIKYIRKIKQKEAEKDEGRGN